MVRNRKDNLTLDLLDWQPPKAEVSFEPEEIRAHTLYSKFTRAISLATKECPKSRSEIAADMSAYLGEDVTKNMIEAYASPARETHVINLPRFAALIHATKDYRLLSLLPELFGFAVVEDKYLHIIRREAMKEKRAELDQWIEQEDRAARRVK